MEEVIKMFQSRMDDYEEKQDKLLKLNPGNPDISALTLDFSNFRTFVWKTLTLLKTQVELLSLSNNRQKAFMRRKVLLLHNILEKDNKNLFDLVTDIFHKQLKYAEFSCDNTQACHRLGAKKDKPRPILVRCIDLHPRQYVWNNKTALKGTGFTISEFLSKSTIFLEARKYFGIKNCWTVNSKITPLLTDKSKCNIDTT